MLLNILLQNGFGKSCLCGNLSQKLTRKYKWLFCNMEKRDKKSLTRMDEERKYFFHFDVHFTKTQVDFKDNVDRETKIYLLCTFSLLRCRYMTHFIKLYFKYEQLIICQLYLNKSVKTVNQIIYLYGRHHDIFKW